MPVFRLNGGGGGGNGPPGPPGSSAYQVWLDEGNTGTRQDFLDSLEGSDGSPGSPGSAGANGDSAYQIWLNNGNAGSQADFLESLVGEDGSDGTNGTDGEDGLDGNPVYSFAKRSSTATTAISGSGTIIVPWQTALETSADITWSSSNNTRLTIQETGRYCIGGYITYSSPSQRAQANAEIYINGVGEGDFRGDTYVRNSGTSWDYGVIEVSTEPFVLSANDYVELAIKRTSGANATYGTGGTGAITLSGEHSRIWVERMD